MELSKTAKELCSVLSDILADRDSFIATMLCLKTEVNYTEMLEWLKRHPEAAEEDIDNKLDEMGL